MKKNAHIFLVIILSIIPLISLLKPGMYWAHDSQSHLVRIASFYQSLTEGNIFPRWSQSLNAGYGHPIFMFLYPLPSYMASALIFLGFTVSSSIKLVLGLTFILSGVFMYLWLKKHFSNYAALIGTAVWQFAPYRFVNLYVRNALGEHVSFAFVPLVFLSLYTLINKPSNKNAVFAATSLALLLLAHNAVSLMFMPFILLYAFILIKNSQKTPVVSRYFITAFILGFSLSAFFWLPAFFEGKYTLREIVMKGDTFAVNFPTLKQLILPSWGYDNSIPGPGDDLSFQIGIVQWLSFLTAVFLIFKNKIKSNKALIILSAVAFVFSVFLILEISLPFWKLVTIIKKFQFPWRFLIMPVFASSVLATAIVPKRKAAKLVVVVTATLLILNINYFKPRGDYLPPDQQVISNYLGTSDTGESVPRWAIRSQEKRADETLGVVHGAPIKYDILKRQSEIHEHTITASVDTQVAENTLYFPGWKVYVDGIQVPIVHEDQNWRGVITYPVTAGTHKVKVIFEETKLRLIADWVSIISLVGVFGILIISPYEKKV